MLACVCVVVYRHLFDSLRFDCDNWVGVDSARESGGVGAESQWETLESRSKYWTPLGLESRLVKKTQYLKRDRKLVLSDSSPTGFQYFE